MADTPPQFTVAELEALLEGTTPGPWRLMPRTSQNATTQYVCAGPKPEPPLLLGHVVAQMDSGYSAKAAYDQRTRDLRLAAAAPSLASALLAVYRFTAQEDRPR